MKLQAGDHIRVKRGLYWHHGIYAAMGRVIHLDKSKQAVLETSLDDFLGCGSYIDVISHAGAYDPNCIVIRARSQIGRTGYDLISNNCEHFAHWCVCGDARSEQVEAAFVAGGAILLLCIIAGTDSGHGNTIA